MHINRRDFMRKSITAALGGVGLCSALGNLKLIGSAAAAGRSFPDYKALVCVFLYGGNDSINCVVPYDAAHHGAYRQSRNGLIADGGLAFDQSTIAANALDPLPASGGLPGGLPSDGGTYGLNPALSGIRSLFNNGKAAVIANVGTLLYPITRPQYINNTVPSPAQLGSHDDQANQWQTSRPDFDAANGWGGRIADLLYASNSGTLPMTISLTGYNRFQRGGVINPYSIADARIATMNYLTAPDWNVPAGGVAAFNALMSSGAQAHVLERAFANATTSAIDSYEIVNAALNASSPLATPFPDTSIGHELQLVARLIKARASLGMSRQIFFVAGRDGYDTHGSQIAMQQPPLTRLSEAMSAFYDATVELGLSDKVTAFTASDFGRSLSVNADGTDHGWGGHHFVVGGAVRGRRFYGTMPSLVPGYGEVGANPDCANYGQIIPTLSVDQYSATLASWFGVDAAGIADIFPNLNRFSTPNLRFMG